MNPGRIYTDRLVLVPMTYEMACSALEGTCSAIEAAGLKTAGRWPEADTLEILPIVRDRLTLYGSEPDGFGSWLFARKGDMVIVGDGGFKNFPAADGIVEIGYGMLTEERRKGYCFEAVSALIEWAFTNDNIQAVIADCLIDNTGSARVLQKCGMQEAGVSDGLIHWKRYRSTDCGR